MLQQLVEHIIEQLMSEGGLGGHMMHVYDNPNLTFSEMKKIFELASTGKLEHVEEKIDGQNIFASYNISAGELRFARNKGDIKSGGMVAGDILNKWEKAPAVRNAFFNAYVIMSKAMQVLGSKTLEEIFGPDGNVWISTEIVYTETANVINYDRNALVFHATSMTAYDKDGKVIEDANLSRNTEMLLRVMKKMQEKISESGWKISGPVLYPLKTLSDKTAQKTAEGKIAKLLAKYGLSDSDTILDFITASFKKTFLEPIQGLSSEEKEELAEAYTSDTLKPSEKRNLAMKVAGEEIYKEYLQQLFDLKSQDRYIRSLKIPLEQIVHEFATSVLDGANSLLSLHPDAEIKRLQKAVESEIQRIKQAGSEQNIEELERHLQKLGGVDKITSSMEGIVFRHKGNTYKFTGSFAPVNKILGILRYMA